jgi:hypothetical protein
MPVPPNLILLVFTRSQAEPGNAYPEARPPIFMESLRGRARVKSVSRLFLEVNFHVLGVLHIRSFRVRQVVGLLRQIRCRVWLSYFPILLE